MRTKVDKEERKAAAQRLRFKVSLPSVILDASQCAQFLDGPGKFSAVVVEKEGKLVPASTFSKTSSVILSSLSTSSSPLSPSEFQIQKALSPSIQGRLISDLPAASEPNTSRDVNRIQPPNVDVKLSSPLEDKSGHALTDSVPPLPLSNTNSSNPPCKPKEKEILKPPKKRRAYDKGAYEIVSMASTPAIVIGENDPIIVSPMHDCSRGDTSEDGKKSVKSLSSSLSSVSSLSVSSSTSSSSCSFSISDSSQKYSIDNLLQTQTSNKNNNNINISSNSNLISGRITHRPYEPSPPNVASGGPALYPASSSCTPHNLESSPSSIFEQTSKSHTSLLSTRSSTSSSSLSSCSIAYNGSICSQIPLNNEHPPSRLSSHYNNDSSHDLSCQSVEVYSQRVGIGMESSTVDNESRVPTFTSSNMPPPLSSAAPGAMQRSSFHQSPEQDEPINLSTSIRMANSTTLQYVHVGSDILDEKVPENNENKSKQKHNAVKVNSSSESESAWKDKPNMLCSSKGEASSSAKQLKDFVSNEHSVHSSGMIISNHNNDGHDKAHKQNKSLDEMSPFVSQTKVPLSLSPPDLVCEHSAEKKHSLNSHNLKVSDEPPSNLHDVERLRNDKSIGHCVQAQSIELKETSTSTQTPTCSAVDSGNALESVKNVNGFCDKVDGAINEFESSKRAPEKSSIPKIKKPPKKRFEALTHEKSSAHRLARYSGSINCVVTDFVFKPDTSDGINLTDEEEAIIRKQFEDTKAENEENHLGEEEKPKTGELLPISASKMVDTSDLEKKNIDEISPSVYQSTEIKDSNITSSPSSSSRKEKTLKPLKKRENVVKSFQRKKSCIPSVLANIESVLTLVAADVNNVIPPSEEGMLELDENYGHLLRKKKKKVSPECENNFTDKESVENVKQLEGSDILSGDSMEKEVVLAVETKEKMKHVSSDSGAVENRNNSASKSIPKEGKKTAKYGKKRKLDSEYSAVESDLAVPKSEKTESKNAGEAGDISKSKKKKLDCKGKVLKKKKSEKIAEKNATKSKDKINKRSSTQTLDEKDLSNAKVETSDLGESIASVSGGSEQVTPVHELETKDEGTSTSSDLGMDKENQDISTTSGSEEKPVRHYKKRLEFVKCPQCDHQARGRSALSRHMKKIHMINEEMPYRCTICTYGCNKMASLNRHLFTHGVFPCSRCEFKTDSKDKLAEHLAENHKDKMDMKLCKVCNRYIKCDNETIEQHTENCQGPMPFKCTECDKEFKYGSSLKVHYHTHFPDQPKRFKCELCDYRTNYKANLHKHHKNMHASKDKDIQCPDCGKLFSTEDNMRRHRKVHTLARPFACETCKKTFKTSGALKGHQLIHTATRPFTCNIPGCNRSFRTPKFLKSHQEEFHRLVPKKFFCQVDGCNYSFFKRSHLKRHAITHTGERNFHCTWPGCRKSFRHADNLKVHFRGHTNDKPIQCHLCDFKCKQKNSLFWHKKKVHQIVEASTLSSRRESSSDSLKTAGEPLSKEVGVSAQISPSPSDEEQDVIDHHESTKVGGGGTVEEGHTKKLSNKDCGEVGSSNVKCAKNKKSPMTSEKGSGPTDLYEFKSDDESEEEGISPLRREKMNTAVLPPLPPPPKELLMKIEKKEQKEREKHEKAEQKEKERKDRIEQKEQEKKEKAEKKEREKKERAEKKEQEKKDKEDKKEQEKKEKEDKKEQEKKEKEEKKEQERKEREAKKEMEKKEKEDKKEQEKKEKEEKREQERKDKEEKILAKKKARLEKKEKARKEKERRKLEVKKLKMEARRILQKGSCLRRRTSAAKLKKKEDTDSSSKTKEKLKEKKSLKRIQARRKSLCRSEAESKVETIVKKLGRGRKKKIVMDEKKKVEDSMKKKGGEENMKKKKKGEDKVNSKKAQDEKSENAKQSQISKRKGKASKGEEPQAPSSRSSSPRAAGRKSPSSPRAAGIKSPSSPRAAGIKSPSSPRAAGRKSPISSKIKTDLPSKAGRGKACKGPKRRPSARIKAINKKADKKAKLSAKKTVIVSGEKKKPGRKKKIVVEEVEEEEVEEVEEKKELEDIKILEDNKVKEEQAEVEENKSEKTEVKKTEVKKKETRSTKIKKDTQVIKEHDSHERDRVSSQPSSPAYSEENMLQGNASPYRDFSEAENLDEEYEIDDKKEKKELSLEASEQNSPRNEDTEGLNSSSFADCITKGTVANKDSTYDDLQDESIDKDENGRSDSCPPDESSDDEVINDIPLTPPRAPAPPPPESSEDEMEPEPDTSVSDVCQPFSVPGPNTPFSVPGPNTPFSVPGPNTPFSVPPPTNLMQQHSVHSEEMPMSNPVPSVASMEIPSVEMQQNQGSVELQAHGSVEMHHPSGSVEMHHPSGSVEMHHPSGSVEMHHPNGSVEMHHPIGSVEMHHPSGSVEMHHPSGSVEMHHPSGSVEMHHPIGSVEMHHPSGSVEKHHPIGSVEMHHPIGSVEMHHPIGSVEMHHPIGSVEMHPHGSVEMQQHANNSAEMNHSHGSVEIQPPHSVISEPMSQSESHPLSNLPPDMQTEARGDGLVTHDNKYGLPPILADDSQTMDADRKSFDQYLKSLHHIVPQQHQQHAGIAHLECPSASSSPSDLQQLEAMVDKSHHHRRPHHPSDSSRDLMSKSPPHTSHHIQQQQPAAGQHLLAMPTSVITSIENPLHPSHMAQNESRSRIESLSDRHHDPTSTSLYLRDTMSALPRFPDRQSSATPLLPSNHTTTPTPAFDTYSTLNPLHPTAVSSSRDNPSYLRQQESLFATQPVTSGFMTEAMFQRQAMTTPFLHPPPPVATPQPSAPSSDRNSSSLSRIPGPASTLRTTTTSSTPTASLIHRPTTVQGSEMFTSRTEAPQAVPRHPFPVSNVWPGQEVRPAAHWQNPYLPSPRQSNVNVNMGHHANSPFFPPTKDNYLTGREFMLDPSAAVRASAERGMGMGMFSPAASSSTSSSQPQDSFQMDRFDIANYIPTNAMTPYGPGPSSSSSSTSAGALSDYTRSLHNAAAAASSKPFNERYRQSTAIAAAASAGTIPGTIPDFRGPGPAPPEHSMFPGIGGVNSGFNLYPSNAMAYHHGPHMPDNMNMNSAFLAHSSATPHPHMMLDLDRDYAAARAAHRGLYPHHQNPAAAYPFIDERQYSGSSKLVGATHPAVVPTTVTVTHDRERDILSRAAMPESQMQDPYRSMLYRY